MSDTKPLAWVDEYAPETVEQCILPARIKKTFSEFVKQKSFPNLLLVGGAGTGKTSIAKALCKDLDLEDTLINASKDRNLSLIGRLETICGSESLSDRPKVIILDEADGLNPQSAQPALRGLIEQFPFVRFILTANYKNRILEPIQSRMATVEFNILESEREDMMLQLIMRLFDILKNENVKFDRKVVAELVKKFYPDNRRIINSLERYSAGGVIDQGLLSHLENANIDVLVPAVKDKDLGACRKWMANNTDMDPALFFEEVYNKFYNEVKPETENGGLPILDFIELVARYQDMSTRVANQEINNMGLIAGMMRLEYK